jgi:hypothetical protein
MAIQFPAGPFIGDTFPYEGMIYTYDGEKWTAATDKAYWDKTGDDLIPKEPGDNVDLGTGDLSANNAEFDGSATFAGNAEIKADGSATLSQGNIALNLDGSAHFAGGILDVSNAGTLFTNNNGAYSYNLEATAQGGMFSLYPASSSPTIQFNGNTGSATFNSTLRVGESGSNNSADFRLQGSGADKRGAVVLSKADSSASQDGITFVAGGGTAAVIKYNGTTTFNLEYDNPARYTSTTNAEGVTESVYSGPTLDVKDSLTKLIAAVAAIRLASEAAGTLEDLKSAIATATADF